MKKKVLGVSFGRKLGNCDIMVKQALMVCEKEGYEVAFIQAVDLNVSNCTGCIACTVQIITGKGSRYCVRHDDFDILDECIIQSDAIILACPTYETSVTDNLQPYVTELDSAMILHFVRRHMMRKSSWKAKIGTTGRKIF